MGWKSTKFHILLHLVDDIKRLSIPMNYDGNVVESHHKEEKKSGRRTQMRASLLDKQTAIKRTEHMLIEKAYNAFHPPKSFLNPTIAVAEESKPSGLKVESLSSNKMVYVPNIGLCFTRNGAISKKVVYIHDSAYLIHQINEFFEYFFDNTNLPSNGAAIYCRLILEQEMSKEDETVMYHGDPFWTSSHIGNSCNEVGDVDESYSHPDPWHDFAYIKWRLNNSDHSEDWTVIPTRILFFFKIPDGCEGQDADDDLLVYPPGSYALIQSCVEDIDANPPTSATANEYYREKYLTNTDLPSYLAHPSCSILCWTMMELTEYAYVNKTGKIKQRVPKLYVVSTSYICGSCLAVPYDLWQHPTIEWIVVRNREDWERSMLIDMEVRVEDDEKKKLRKRRSGKI
jgi:hypothetical protein